MAKTVRLPAESPDSVRARDLTDRLQDHVGKRIAAWRPEDSGDREDDPIDRADGMAKEHNFHAEFGWESDGTQFGYIVAENNESNAGMVAHRGVLDEREFDLLDWGKVREITLAKLGVSHDQFEFAYSDRAGKPSPAARAVRDHVDERLLAISEAGGNMAQLANILLWDVDPVRGSRKMRRALERAREAREAKRS